MKKETPTTKATTKAKRTRKTSATTSTRKNPVRKTPAKKERVPALEETPAVKETPEMEVPSVKIPISEFFDEIEAEGQVYTAAELRDLKKRMKEAGHSRKDIQLLVDSAPKVAKVDKEAADALTDRLEQQCLEDVPFSTFDPENNVFKTAGKKMTNGEAYLKTCRSVMDGKQYIAALNYYLSDGSMSLSNYKEQMYPVEDMEKMVAEFDEPRKEMFKTLQSVYGLLQRGFLEHQLPEGTKVGSDVVISYLGATRDWVCRVERLYPTSFTQYRSVDEKGVPVPYSRPKSFYQDNAVITGIKPFVPELAEAE